MFLVQRTFSYFLSCLIIVVHIRSVVPPDSQFRFLSLELLAFALLKTDTPNFFLHYPLVMFLFSRNMFWLKLSFCEKKLVIYFCLATLVTMIDASWKTKSRKCHFASELLSLKIKLLFSISENIYMNQIQLWISYECGTPYHINLTIFVGMLIFCRLQRFVKACWD